MKNLIKDKNIIKGIVLFIALFSLLFNTCTSEYIQKNEVCFERDVRPIINSNCAGSGCHDAITRESGKDYTTFEGIMRDVNPGNYKTSKLYSVLIQPSFSSTSMPPAPNTKLSTDQITVIARWIEEGAKNSSCTSGTSCDTAKTISYNNDIKPILATNCAGSSCHSASNQAGSISYATYQSTLPSATNGQLLGSIQFLAGFSSMPKNASKLGDCDIAMFKKWINNGAPNN